MPKQATPWGMTRTQWAIIAGLALMTLIVFSLLMVLSLATIAKQNQGTANETPTMSQVAVLPQWTSTPRWTDTLLPTYTPRPTVLLATSTPQPAGYASSNPVRLGQSVMWTGRDGEQLKLTVLEFYRGQEAWRRIKAANQYNTPPPQGWEYFLFRVRADFLREGKKLSIIMGDSNFVLISSTGREFRSFEGPTIVPPDPMFSKEVYVRGFVDGWMAFSALAGDSHPVLAFGRAIFPDELRIWLDTR